jgi:hypothetical protein
MFGLEGGSGAKGFTRLFSTNATHVIVNTREFLKERRIQKDWRVAQTRIQARFEPQFHWGKAALGGTGAALARALQGAKHERMPPSL